MASVFFISLGCPKNLVDSQVMLGLLDRDHYHIASNPEAAEVIIINTCSFIEAAQKESVDTILEMAELKQTGLCKVLVVSGCLVQRYTQELEKEFPEVDLFIGTGEYHRITELLQNLKPFKRSYVNQPAFIHTEDHPRLLTGPRFSAYLKLSEGCNRRCSFCIIPKLRGNVRSRSPQSLVNEAQQLASQGAVELNLVAQDLTEYGMEWKYQENLSTLLPQLCEIPKIQWIRLHYVYPDAFSSELVHCIAHQPKIVKYLDMPIQHTQDRILNLMNRRLRREQLFQLIQELRSKIPTIVFRTSIIVGFPGETEAEFEALCEDLLQLQLNHVGIFEYSREKDTPAADLPHQLHPATKRKRHRILKQLLEDQSLKHYQRYLGQRIPVLLEGFSQETELLFQGRMATQAQEIDGHVLINHVDASIAADLLQPGTFVEVEMTEALPDRLIGHMTRILI